MKDQSFHSFFAICTPGLEEILFQEIERRRPLLVAENGLPVVGDIREIESVVGGVSFKAPLLVGLQLNLFLKTATRILLRLISFECREFSLFDSQLKKQMALPELADIFDGPLSFEISCSQSKLNNEKRIREICDRLKKSLPKKAKTKVSADHLIKSTSENTVYIRIHNDKVMISLDSSGELLHKRGWRIKAGTAPARETLAASLFFMLQEGVSQKELRMTQLMDPFVGSGTMLREANDFDLSVRRDFPFFQWKMTPKILKSEDFLKNRVVLNQGRGFKKYLGVDNDPECTELSRTHLEALPHSVSVGDWTQKDLTFIDQADKSENTWLIGNPPYGKRVDLDFDLPTVLKQIAQKTKAEKVGWLLPIRLFSIDELRRLHPSFKLDQVVKTENGGIPVYLAVFSRTGS